MTTCEALSNWGFTCQQVNPATVFVQTPLALAFDGQAIGFYVQQFPDGKLRLSDNADTLFAAQVHGIPLVKKTKQIDKIAEQSCITLSDDGELCVICENADLHFYAARMTEAADKIGALLQDAKPKQTNRFELQVLEILKPAFGRMVKRNAKIVGASGHTLTFPFMLNLSVPRIISTVGCDDDGKPHWPSVYQTVGKMMDVKNAGHQSKRIVIMEQGSDGDMRQAEAILAEASSIIKLNTHVPQPVITALAA